MRRIQVDVWPDERLVKMANGLLESMFIRDDQGNRLRVEWGAPNPDGTYTPTVHIEYDDNVFKNYIRGLPSDTARRELLWNLDVCLECGGLRLPCGCTRDD